MEMSLGRSSLLQNKPYVSSLFDFPDPILNPGMQLLAQAQLGSLTHIRSLTRMVLKSGKPFDVGVVQCLKDFVLSQPPPKIDDIAEGSSVALQKAEFAIHCIFSSADLLTREEYRERAGRLLLPHWEMMAHWVEFIVGELAGELGKDRDEVRALVRCSAILLAKTARAGGWSTHLFRDVERIAGAVTMLWCYPDDDGLPLFISSATEESGCPVISLFENWCYHNEASTVFDRLQDRSGDSLSTMFHFTSNRLKAIRLRLDNRKVTEGGALMEVRSLWRVMVNLIARTPPERLFDAMIRFKVFRRIVRSLLDITKRVLMMPQGEKREMIRREGVEIVTEVVYGMLLSTDPTSAITQGINGGLYNYLIDYCLPYTSVMNPQHAVLLDAFRTLSLHGVYPEIRRATVKSNSIPDTEEGVNGLKRRFPSFVDVLRMLEYANSKPPTRKESVAYLKQMCDNPIVSRIRSSSPFFTQLFVFSTKFRPIHEPIAKIERQRGPAGAAVWLSIALNNAMGSCQRSQVRMREVQGR
jgi:hypothetical protein